MRSVMKIIKTNTCYLSLHYIPRFIQAGQKSRILLLYPFKPGLISLFLEGASQLSSTGGSQTEADAEVHPPGNEVLVPYQ
jgi:hypothetical protein